jgi:penicillin-binding protein 2
MFNAPHSCLQDDDPANPARGWLDHPTTRLRLVVLIFLIPAGAIGYRLVQLQTVKQSSFTQVFEATTTKRLEIPARDGRILAADGSPLAVDVETFELRVDYRWLEEPPHPEWLKRQAFQRLSRRQRRDTDQVAAISEQVLRERDEMWQRLARVVNLPESELTSRRHEIQTRIERMRSVVLNRQSQKSSPSSPSQAPAIESFKASSPADLDEYLAWWEGRWHEFHRELTTPPARRSDEPFILAEELEAHPLVVGITETAAAEIQAQPELYPGLEVRVLTHRSYPAKTVAAHLLGVRTPLREEEARERSQRWPAGDPLDYRTGDPMGRSGLELAYDAQLRGLRGLKELTIDRRGQIVAKKILREPRHGSDLYLSLDVEVQRTAESLLEQALAANDIPSSEASPKAATEGVTETAIPSRTIPTGGSVVVIDVRMGQVIAAASAPGYDANILTSPTADEWARLTNDARRPFFQRVTRMALAPGSTFKPLTAIAGLEAGMKASTSIDCVGYLDHPNRDRCLIFRHFGVGHGETDLSDALCQSCNVYFFKMARMSGPQPLVAWARQFGFGQLTGIDLPFEQTGRLPSPETATKAQPWYPGDTLGLAIGQSRLQVTPLQMARFMAAIANGGELVTPRLKADFSPMFIGSEPPVHGSSPSQSSSASKSRTLHGLHPTTMDAIREGLVRVVNDPKGTAYKTVRMKEVEIAGKTGTAEAGGGLPDHAWFAGYAPARQPRYAIVVVLEHGGSGGRQAGPMARDVLRKMHQLGLLPTGSLARNDD